MIFSWGAPWGKMARAAFINEDNGDYVCRIKAPDRRRIVQFVVAKADHPRNRCFAREADGSFSAEHLKAQGTLPPMWKWFPATNHRKFSLSE